MTQTMTAPLQAPQAAPAEIQAEAPIIIQSGDLEGNRWSDLRSDLVQVVAGLANKLGFNMLPDENLLKLGFPIEDDSRFDNGLLDTDFEESSIEALLKMQKDGVKFANIAARFAHNLQIRNHEPIQVDSES